MGRGRAIGAGVITALAVVTVAAGAASGVLALTDITGQSTTPEKETIVATGTAPAPAPVKAPVTAATPTVEPKPAVFEPGDKGEKVRELQARLKQLKWYAPKINGKYDGVTEKAVKGFQGKRKFEKTGIVDERTWKRIVKMSRTPTDDEMHNRLTPGPTLIGPASSGDEVRELQARLKQIGWFFGDVTDSYGSVTTEAVSGFQAKREIPVTGEVDQRTLDRLNAMTREPTRNELLNIVPKPAENGALDPRCMTGRVLCIDKSTNSLRWVIDGTTQMRVDVRFGSDELPTREGQFSVNYKSRDHVSSLYNTSMPYAMFFSGGQAVHYSPDFAANGYNGASHGCVNVRDYGAVQSLFNQVNVGDKVIVYWS